MGKTKSVRFIPAKEMDEFAPLLRVVIHQLPEKPNAFIRSCKFAGGNNILSQIVYSYSNCEIISSEIL